MINIKSCSSNRELKISLKSSSSLHVELVGFPISAQTSVWAETGDAAGLQDFFAELGKLERPWIDRRVWQSLEHDFKLAVTCNALGNVTFDLELCGLQGSTEEWTVRAGIDYEFGQLGRLLL